MDLWIKLTLLCSCCFGASADFDGRWPRQMASSTGLCRYGPGWTAAGDGHAVPGVTASLCASLAVSTETAWDPISASATLALPARPATKT
ncbi:hypothetical protein PFLUV_G00010370 [Perca fluviatilis]|uniref:Secreted protein n=1 Tax=Perca fluviatilis TaxID=8168 RepID=A0A6A5FRQ1_PERFL|nr:hypothetical protein PFLUV_G00010370 [Perca fluviatilis]